MKLDLMAVPDLSTPAGAITFWRLSGNANLEKLKAGLAARDIDENLAPEFPSKEKALRRVMQSFGDPHRLVRPLKNVRGHVLVDEIYDPGSTEPRYQNYAMVQLDAYSETGVSIFGNTAWDFHEAVVAKFKEAQQTLESTDVGNWLCDMVRQVRAVPLRDTGGVYFVPEPARGLWNGLIEALREASPTYVAQIPALRSSEALAAILDGLRREAESAVENMNRELVESEGDEDRSLGTRALQTRTERVASLEEKVTVYENLLQVSLEDVHSQLEGLRGSLAASMLIAQAQKVEG